MLFHIRKYKVRCDSCFDEQFIEHDSDMYNLCCRLKDEGWQTRYNHDRKEESRCICPKCTQDGINMW